MIIFLKYDFFDASKVNSIWQPLLFSILSDETTAHKLIRKPQNSLKKKYSDIKIPFFTERDEGIKLCISFENVRVRFPNKENQKNYLNKSIDLYLGKKNQRSLHEVA